MPPCTGWPESCCWRRRRLRAAGPPEPATLVLRGGKIITMDEARPQVQALAARGERIVAVGAAEEVQAYIGPATEVIDLAGLTAVPGFIDGHAHFMGLGQSRLVLDLREARTWDDIVAMVREAAATRQARRVDSRPRLASGEVVVAPAAERGGFPVHAALSQASPNNPVFLEHASGHAGFFNARALAAAASPPPPGTRRAARS